MSNTKSYEFLESSNEHLRIPAVPEIYRTTVEFHFNPTSRQTTKGGLGPPPNPGNGQPTNGRFISTLLMVPISKDACPDQAPVAWSQLSEVTRHDSPDSKFTLPPFPSSYSRQWSQWAIGNCRVVTDDLPLPPPPSPLASDDEIFNEILIEPPPVIYQSGAVQAANYNNDYGHLYNLPPYVQAARVDSLAAENGGKRYITKVQVLVSTASHNKTEKVISSEPRSPLDHVDSTMGDLKSCHWFSGDQEVDQESTTMPLSNAISPTHQNIMRPPRKRDVKSRKSFLPLPRHLPWHRRIVRLSSGSSPNEARMICADEKVSARLSLKCIKSQAIQTGDVTEGSSIDRLLRDNSLVNYGRLLSSKEGFGYNTVKSKRDIEETSVLESSGPEEVLQPYRNFRLTPPNYNRLWLTPQTKAQVQTDRVDLVERGTSPVDFAEPVQKCGIKDGDNHFLERVTANMNANVMVAERMLWKGEDQNDSERVVMNMHDDILVAAAAPPSPILTCTVLKSDKEKRFYEKTLHSTSVEAPRPTPRGPQQPPLCPQKSVVYATILTSDSLEMNMDAYRGKSVVVVDGVTPLPQGYIPSPNVHLPTCTICRDAAGEAVPRCGKRSSKRAPATNPQSGADLTTAAVQASDYAIHQQNPSHRELVSSVSSGHRPPYNGTSRISSSSSSPSYSTYTCSASCTGRTSDSPTVEETRVSHSSAITSRLTSESDIKVNIQGHTESGLPQVNVVRATPERRSSTLATRAASVRGSSSVEARATQTPIGSGHRSIDLDVFGYVPDEQQRQVVQEWLVNRVSANVAVHFGSKLSQMLHESASVHSDANEEAYEDMGSSRDLRNDNVVLSRLLSKSHGEKSKKTLSGVDSRCRLRHYRNDCRMLCSPSSPVEQQFERKKRMQPMKRTGHDHQLSVSRIGPHNSNRSTRILSREAETQHLALPIPTTQHLQPSMPPASPPPVRSMPRIRIRSKPSASTLKSGEVDKGKSNTATYLGISNEEESIYGRVHPYEQIIEIAPHDELVHSYQNVHDRRIKAVGMKTGCFLDIKGPIKRSPVDGNMRREREVYELTIGASSKEKADRCINYLRDTFPRAVLTKKMHRSNIFNKVK
ncbi:unnamed protein product [Taenia asiatica]|uniref:POLAc domain-containing protein n=1 Tax=Taenia asiatica TaxID=60517 RepID=A0A0R3W5U4_TAEAS|nr:unnamed protein product [Taenia asiatica]